MLRRLAVVTAALVVGAVLAAPTTPAEDLAGLWAPLNRCPVDDPAMLAADGVTVAASCLASSSPSGELKLGGTTVHTGTSNLQLGVLNRSGVYTLTGGGIVAEPVEIPGGLLGLMCPSEVPAVSEICDAVVGSDLNRVTAVLEPAGAPTDFDLGAGLTAGRPILTLPVKVHLRNPFLDPNCYIGPILLRPANLTRPTPRFIRFNADGTANPTGEMGYVSTSGVSQGDSTFAVPEADGCGLAGLLDGAVNLKQGLPSPAGNNSVVLTDTSTQVGGFFTPSRFAPTQGKQLSERWHAAVLPVGSGMVSPRQAITFQ